MGQAFGKFRQISGKGGDFDATAVPLELLADLKSNAPIPITISGTNQVIFTVNASKTDPVNLWNGNDFIQLKESLAYTWTANTNNILSSTGAAATQSATATGVWYYYVGLNSSGTLVIRPSQSEPKSVEGPFQSGHFIHPGTARAQYWSYVGFGVATATTPAFDAMTKIGFTYNFAGNSVATATTWAALDFSATVPKHGPLGLTVGGHLETGAEGAVTVGSTSTNTLGIQTASIAINTTTHTAVLKTPFSNINPTSAGKVWAQHTTAAGDVHITSITDVV